MKKNIPLVVGNWKCNPVKEVDAITLVAAVVKAHKKAEAPYIAIAPTALHSSAVAKKLSKSPVMLAAQAVSPYTVGAHTGELTVRQYKDSGATFILLVIQSGGLEVSPTQMY